MTEAKCIDCGNDLAWYDHARFNKGRCRSCASNAYGRCAKMVYSKSSMDVLGSACSFKAVGPSPDQRGYKGWKYCKRHGGKP